MCVRTCVHACVCACMCVCASVTCLGQTKDFFLNTHTFFLTAIKQDPYFQDLQDEPQIGLQKQHKKLQHRFHIKRVLASYIVLQLCSVASLISNGGGSVVQWLRCNEFLYFSLFSLNDSESGAGLPGRQAPSVRKHLINDLENTLPFQLIK